MSMKMLWLLLVLPLEEAPQFWGLQGWNVPSAVYSFSGQEGCGGCDRFLVLGALR